MFKINKIILEVFYFRFKALEQKYINEKGCLIDSKIVKHNNTSKMCNVQWNINDTRFQFLGRPQDTKYPLPTMALKKHIIAFKGLCWQYYTADACNNNALLGFQTSN